MIYLRGIINIEEEGNKINVMVKFISYFIKYLYNIYNRYLKVLWWMDY